MRSGLRFCNKSTKYPRTPKYDPELNFLLGFKFKIVMIGLVFMINTYFAVLRLSNYKK